MIPDQRVESLPFSQPSPADWQGSLLLYEFDLDPDDLEPFEDVLAPAEREAANRRRNSSLRSRYVCARGALRIVLGALQDRPAASLEFALGPYGKPALPGALSFNLSHSEGSALLAVTDVEGLDETCLGVDLEHVRTWRDLDELALSVYTAPELEWLGAHQTEEAKRRAFFKLWTAKESFMKATGEGLTRPLQEFRVECGGPAEAQPVRSHPADRDLGYVIRELPSTSDTCAALCLASTWKNLPHRHLRLH